MGTTLSRSVVHAGETPTEQFAWGTLTWLDNQDLTGSETLSFGVVTVAPGQGNPAHHHPNCDEVIYVVSGTLQHVVGTETYTLGPGDLLHIPQGVPHHARNEGSETAQATVTHNTGWREVVAD